MGRANPESRPLGPGKIQTRPLLYRRPVFRAHRLDGRNIFSLWRDPRHVPQRSPPFAAEHELFRGDQFVGVAWRRGVLFLTREEVVHGSQDYG